MGLRAKRSYRPFGVGVGGVGAWIVVTRDRYALGLLRGDLVLDGPSKPRTPLPEKRRNAVA
jgi:hypothetical protein